MNRSSSLLEQAVVGTVTGAFADLCFNSGELFRRAECTTKIVVDKANYSEKTAVLNHRLFDHRLQRAKRSLQAIDRIYFGELKDVERVNRGLLKLLKLFRFVERHLPTHLDYLGEFAPQITPNLAAVSQRLAAARSTPLQDYQLHFLSKIPRTNRLERCCAAAVARELAIKHDADLSRKLERQAGLLFLLGGASHVMKNSLLLLAALAASNDAAGDPLKLFPGQASPGGSKVSSPKAG
jgi:hypothetical protein